MSRARAPAADPSAAATFWVCTGITAVAAGLRTVPAFGDLWLDEVWTWVSVQRLHSAWGIFEQIHHSNNNHLNSLVFYWLRDAAHPVVYRLPALLAGIASVPLACLLAGRHGRLEAIVAGVLTGACYALVHFSSEARGYAPAVFFALASALLVDGNTLLRTRPLRVLAFHACVILGFLSHLVFLFFLAGLIAQLAWRAVHTPPPRAPMLRRFGILFVPPLLALLALYWVDLRFLRVGGGDATPLSWWASRSVAFALGLSARPELAAVNSALAAAGMVLGLRLSRRSGDDDWVLMSVAIVLAPALILAAMRPDVIAVRYFLIGIALYLILTSRVLAAGIRAGGWRRAIALGCMGVFLVGNAIHIAPFLRLGRGGYAEALHFIADASEAPTFTVTSDHDFRTGMVLRFYARNLPESKRMIYQERANRPRAGSEWLIVHAGERPDPPRAFLRDGNGNRYRFARGFDHAAISGFWWGVYRLEPTDTGASAPSR